MAEPDDSWIIVSGGGGALGGALAAHYGAIGRRVFALDRQFAADRAPRQGVVTRVVDLLAEDAVRSIISETIGPSERVSLLINAVGLIWNEPLLAFREGKLLTHSLETWRRVTDANLTAPFVLGKHVAAHMTAHGGGCIVNFSSIASGGNQGQAAYGAAKAGLEGLTETMAIELGPLGVRVNALALGFIDVGTTRQAVAEKRLAQYSERTPLGRLGLLDEVVNAVEFLATNSFINGAIVRIDGGLRL
jgi:3-oxoacyl-[acyl-carrier protein] reductase